MSVILMGSVARARLVTGSPTGVFLPASKESVGRMPTARPSTTGLSVPVPLTSWETRSQGATLSAPDTMTAPLTRPVSSSSARTLAMSPTLMCVVKELPVNPLTTRLCVPVLEATLVIPS